MTHPSRRTRIITVLFALLCVLSAQLSLAAYACPGAGTGSEQVRAMDMKGMPCAGEMAGDMTAQMDAEQPGMCKAHCQSLAQSADQYQVPALSSILQMGPVLTVTAPPVVIAQAPHWQRPILKRTTAPPIAVRHCCFRL
jgi:hypothetical protein